MAFGKIQKASGSVVDIDNVIYFRIDSKHYKIVDARSRKPLNQNRFKPFIGSNVIIDYKPSSTVYYVYNIKKGS